jgi:inhibitor of cysteine peptidase
MVADPQPAVVLVTEADHGTRVRAAPGDELLLKLPAQPGTGFCWVVVRGGTGRLEQLAEPYFEDPKGRGAGGTQLQVFRLRVRAAGTGVLELAYRRVFEKNTPPARTFSVEVDTNEPSPSG